MARVLQGDRARLRREKKIERKEREQGSSDLQKFQRVCRVFLARLLTCYGTAAPDLLRRMADELEWLERDRRDGDL